MNEEKSPDFGNKKKGYKNIEFEVGNHFEVHEFKTVSHINMPCNNKWTLFVRLKPP